MTIDPPTDSRCGDHLDSLGRSLSCELPIGHDGAHEAYYGERRWSVRWLPAKPITWGSYHHAE